MPTFTLSELADAADKSLDTMQNWFDRGFFGKAGFRTAGKQRRVRASSADEAVETARRKMPKGYERERPSKDDAAKSALAKAFRKMGRLDRKIGTSFRVGDSTTRLISASVNFLAAQKGQTSDDDLGWITGEDETVPLVERLKANPFLCRLLSQGPDVVEAAVCARRIYNRGGEITREKVAAEQGMSASTHRTKFSEFVFKQIKAAAFKTVAPPSAEGLEAEVRLLTEKLGEMLNKDCSDDSHEALAGWMKMSLVEFYRQYPRHKIEAAYRQADLVQLAAETEPEMEHREDTGLGYDAVEADNVRFAKLSEQSVTD